MHSFGAPVYVEEDVERDDSIFDLPPTDATQKMGIPMVARKFSGDMEWDKARTALTFPDENQMAAITNMFVDPRHEKFRACRNSELGSSWSRKRRGSSTRSKAGDSAIGRSNRRVYPQESPAQDS